MAKGLIQQAIEFFSYRQTGIPGTSGYVDILGLYGQASDLISLDMTPQELFNAGCDGAMGRFVYKEIKAGKIKLDRFGQG